MPARTMVAPRFLSFAMVSAITAVAGYVDAVGFMHLSGLYLSFMSGNTTRLGTLIATADWPAVVVCCAVIASFVAGATLGTLASERYAMSGPAPILAAEAALVGVGLILSLFDDGPYSLLLIVVAMGMQNVLHRTISGADAGKTFVTGALFSLGQSIAHLVSGKGNLAEPAILAASWAAFVIGATSGGFLLARLHLTQTLGLALLLLIAAAAVAAWLTPPRPQ
ncbi:YoaK family protein [Kaistia dalseonensis]|uniref:Oxalate decarboxylase n=1 Tax=Kaistia dalseonensis TaxID=410840 RepID=A0ABU0H8I1_9HYPH|nr:YoaK family protein [Kaistia dalseonensis]MCX5495716.1 YoaK family protein [Kaistia dalseonensis]MDQ0438312.1 oxalate decarboxylase [Kaistia dalseonensis]